MIIHNNYVLYMIHNVIKYVKRYIDIIYTYVIYMIHNAINMTKMLHHINNKYVITVTFVCMC